MTLMFDSGLISWGDIICWSVLGVNGIKEEPSSIKVNDSKIKPIFSVHQELFLLFFNAIQRQSRLHHGCFYRETYFHTVVVYCVHALLVNVCRFNFCIVYS